MTSGSLLAVASTLVLALQSAVSAAVPIDDFRSADAWSVNHDGGAIEISQGSVKSPSGGPTLRLVYASNGYAWGNAVRSVSLPPQATAVEFDLFVSHADPQANLFVWLLEEDGDGHMTEVSPAGRRLSECTGRWEHCTVPMAKLNYDPRGNRVNELLTVNRMLIGMNNAKADICIANLSFMIADNASKSEPRTENIRIVNGKKGRVAVLQGSLDAAPGNADPIVLSKVLSDYGYGVTMLKPGDMADESVLSKRNFDCLVLPYGPNYPSSAGQAIRGYLKSGGSLFTTGGYALDRMCMLDASGKYVPQESMITAAELAAGRVAGRRLNTRTGGVGDTMPLEPDQMGMFDPTYHLAYVTDIRASDQQSVVPTSIKAHTAVEGYAACSMLGSNSAVFPDKWGRHISLIKGYDALGRYRGDIGSLAHNYAGPYAGSSWAFFGVTNRDLFASGTNVLHSLPLIVDALVSKTYLHSLETDLSCYKEGESVRISCKVANMGRASVSGRVMFRVLDRRGKTVFSSASIPVSLKQNSTGSADARMTLAKPTSDLYRIVAQLSIDGRKIDMMETGFAVYSEAISDSGLRLNYKDNYFHDGQRRVLLSGTNETGAVFYSGNENPLVWDRDLGRMNENGLNILRVLHFSPFISDTPAAGGVKPTDLRVDRLPLKTERKLDALIQLCQAHKIILFLSIHDWMGHDLSDEELAAQRHFAGLIAKRYRNVPGFIIDIQNEPNIDRRQTARSPELPHVLKGWNDYLGARYGTIEALKAAWKHSPPEFTLGEVPYHAGTNSWDDMRSYDAEVYRTAMTDRWIKENYLGAKEANPLGPVTVGILQEFWAQNKILCTDYVDFVNLHSYTPLDIFRADIKLYDRRFEGKSITVGEFGAFTDHEKRIQGVDNPGQDVDWFLSRGHYLFGVGGSFLANWDWKDMDDAIFPWGINYPCDGPRKDLLKAYRNQSLLFRQVKPVYESPEVFLVIPSDQLYGGAADHASRLLYRFVNGMFDSHIEFGTIDDRHLDKLPTSARLLIYPFPFSIPDDVYGQLRAFVERGGRLVVTGDVSYDALRQRSKTDRLKELCGVAFESAGYQGLDQADGDAECIQVSTAGAVKTGEYYIHKLGSGEVYYTPVPCVGAPATTLNAAIDNLGGHARIDSTADHVFRLPEIDGSCTYVLMNTGEAHAARLVPANGTPVEITLKKGGVGLIRYSKQGKVVAVESQGPVKLGQSGILDMQGHFAVVATDGKEIPASESLMILPSGGGTLKLLGRPQKPALTIQTGDVAAGRWHALSESEGNAMETTGATAFDIAIAAPKERLSKLGDSVASELMLK